MRPDRQLEEANPPYVQQPGLTAPRSHPVRRWLTGAAVLLAGLFWLAALPLPGPLDRARERWWTHAAERRAKVDTYQRDGWPDEADSFRTRGLLVLHGAAGERTLHPTRCESGQSRLFYGVTLRDDAQPGLAARIVLPEDGGDHVVFEQQNRTSVRFDRTNCAVWDAALESEGVVSNGIRLLRGHATFRCTTPSGSLGGNLRFGHCR